MSIQNLILEMETEAKRLQEEADNFVAGALDTDIDIVIEKLIKHSEASVILKYANKLKVEVDL